MIESIECKWKLCSFISNYQKDMENRILGRKSTFSPHRNLLRQKMSKFLSNFLSMIIVLSHLQSPKRLQKSNFRRKGTFFHHIIILLHICHILEISIQFSIYETLETLIYSRLKTLCSCDTTPRKNCIYIWYTFPLTNMIYIVERKVAYLSPFWSSVTRWMWCQNWIFAY